MQITTFARSVASCATVLSALALGSQTAQAQEADNFSQFKRTIAPSYLIGRNGLITLPTAHTIGRYNVYLGTTATEAGEIRGESLYNTRTSLVVGTSEDVELGYTRNVLIWEDGDRTDLDADVYHFKARVFHLADSLLPQVAIGSLAMSLRENDFDSSSDVLFAPFVVATSVIPLGERHHVALTGDMEWLYNSGEQTERFFNAGVSLSLFDGALVAAYEQLGVGRDDFDPIGNLAIQGVWRDMISVGIGLYDVANYSDADASGGLTLKLGLVLPVGQWLEDKE